ncbi:MAG TPA: type II toxin-antitoxin system RelE/ParE family toxin [Allosphingosinicella sp.]|jgi:toxin ParE1/3/4
MAPPRYQVRLTQGAERDLEALYDYLAEHRSADEAEALLEALVGKVETLEDFPERGSVPKELEALGMREFRQILMGRYRMIYRVAGAAVFVMVIADGRRDMQSLLERRLLGR